MVNTHLDHTKYRKWRHWQENSLRRRPCCVKHPKHHVSRPVNLLHTERMHLFLQISPFCITSSGRNWSCPRPRPLNGHWCTEQVDRLGKSLERMFLLEPLAISFCFAKSGNAHIPPPQEALKKSSFSPCEVLTETSRSGSQASGIDGEQSRGGKNEIWDLRFSPADQFFTATSPVSIGVTCVTCAECCNTPQVTERRRDPAFYSIFTGQMHWQESRPAPELKCAPSRTQGSQFGARKHGERKKTNSTFF